MLQLHLPQIRSPNQTLQNFGSCKQTQFSKSLSCNPRAAKQPLIGLEEVSFSVQKNIFRTNWDLAILSMMLFFEPMLGCI
ncbi:hypothetical protein M6B38_148175 [Iris pallida]|uniref:Uncharacterized protein n=1 Tax=Iris pallida TaxID=29817 RepID=A0AAX6ELE7_IRIPA|nr:hypothetical protein M6B38_185470 [Iris pallida]KAJ6812565.1 hypothetical protein M6B38_148175 [Iris pallida]